MWPEGHTRPDVFCHNTDVFWSPQQGLFPQHGGAASIWPAMRVHHASGEQGCGVNGNTGWLTSPPHPDPPSSASEMF